MRQPSRRLSRFAPTRGGGMVVDAASVGSSGDMERFLTARVHDSLGQFLYADATFFCERLHAASPCEVRALRLRRDTAR